MGVLAGHDFDPYFVGYQNLSTHIWLARSLTIFFPQLLAYQIIGMEILVANQSSTRTS